MPYAIVVILVAGKGVAPNGTWPMKPCCRFDDPHKTFPEGKGVPCCPSNARTRALSRVLVEERGIEPHTPFQGALCFRNRPDASPVFLPFYDSVVGEGIEPTTHGASNRRSTF